ncbi:hypothetical protein GCM10010435_64480 [Winogradskya consettensis]|uniref:PASTA domain-containing protein n=1 Tax=Winogradskya consettensis TaxID=113560 RepID=A0A919VQX7_9ACTN|nr:PASTA domain-containing protein [Actinoplanes consettensis]GIM72280.1 hypothetical protein Aco04nite_29480 [Actinoplanes consettensis]
MSDDTGEFFPFRDEDEIEPNGRTGGSDSGAGDETRALPPVPSDADATSVFRPVSDNDATSVYAPASGGASGWDDEDQIWAGRAGVRAPGPADDATRTDWAAVPEDEPRGRWWTPILVGIVAFVLLALLGWGIYLIVRSNGGTDQGTPAVTPTATRAPAATATTGPTSKPSSAAPTSATPSSAVPSTASDITIPALRGLSLDEARNALNRKGLNYRLRYVASTDAPPGTIIGSDPAEGQQVPDDTIVNLIIASEPTATTTPPSTPTATPSVDYDED